MNMDFKWIFEFFKVKFINSEKPPNFFSSYNFPAVRLLHNLLLLSIFLSSENIYIYLKFRSNQKIKNVTRL